MTTSPGEHRTGAEDRGEDRGEELRDRLVAVRARIDAACALAGRDPSSVALIVVTKTYPASDVRLLAQLGVADVGESRDQEASRKADDCADLGLRWHFIGRLQTNKARSVVRYASFVHSVDRLDLVRALDQAVQRQAERAVGGELGAREGRLDCLIQVSLDGDASRGGVAPAGVDGLAAAVTRAPGLRLRGLMAVAPRGADPDAAFAVLPGLLARVNDRCGTADLLSAGMSGDLEAAVRHGATHLRVGTAVLGRRQLTG